MHTAKATNGREIGGREPSIVHPAYCQYGPGETVSPVVLAVPHAGREYPADIVSRSRVGLDGLRALEDRHADVLTSGAIARGHCAVIARRGRAVIDLNRDEAEIDNASVAGVPHGTPMRTSAKLRGGLGLVPHRYHLVGDLWYSRLGYDELCERINSLHKPYHQRISELLREAATRHGGAVLIDIHSMPPIRGRGPDDAPQVVIGDRFGRSAGSDLVEQAMEIARAMGLRVALNAPYAGGHTLDHHGKPRSGVHALQVEIDRTIYLDARLDGPGPGAEFCARFIAELADALGGEIGGGALPVAAE